MVLAAHVVEDHVLVEHWHIDRVYTDLPWQRILPLSLFAGNPVFQVDTAAIDNPSRDHGLLKGVIFRNILGLHGRGEVGRNLVPRDSMGRI